MPPVDRSGAIAVHGLSAMLAGVLLMGIAAIGFTALAWIDTPPFDGGHTYLMVVVFTVSIIFGVVGVLAYPYGTILCWIAGPGRHALIAHWVSLVLAVIFSIWEFVATSVPVTLPLSAGQLIPIYIFGVSAIVAVASAVVFLWSISRQFGNRYLMRSCIFFLVYVAVLTAGDVYLKAWTFVDPWQNPHDHPLSAFAPLLDFWPLLIVVPIWYAALLGEARATVWSSRSA